MPEERERIEHYLRLADRASERFESRRTLEWRLAFGVWLLFAAGAVAVLNIDWSPNRPIAALGTLMSVGIVVVYTGTWLPYLNRSHQREARTAYFWETCVEKALSKDGSRILPAYLRPENKHPDDRVSECEWATAFDAFPGKTGGVQEGDERALSSTLHSTQRGQRCVAIILAVAFVIALWIKTEPAKGTISVKGKLTVEESSDETAAEE